MLYWLLLREGTALAPLVAYRPGHRLGWLGLNKLNKAVDKK